VDVTGHLDLCGPELIEGWIFWRSNPDHRLQLQVFLEERLLGGCTADLFRQDLADAGLGDGNCAFSFRLPEDVVMDEPKSVRLRVAGSVLYLLPDAHTSLPRVAPLPALTGNWAKVR
jgi:hypothetical protein